MRSDLDRLETFEKELGWVKILEKIQTEHIRRIGDVRKNGKETGKSVECAYAIGFADALTWLTTLPKVIREEVDKKTEKTNA